MASVAMATLNKMTSMMAIMAITLVEVILLEVVEKRGNGGYGNVGIGGIVYSTGGGMRGTGRGSCVRMCTLTYIHNTCIHAYLQAYM